jgi:hypothetical protein
MTDWDVFRNACLALLAGQSPYSVGQGEMLFFNPPWALVPLIPLALLPPITGLLLNALISFISLLVITHKLKMGPWGYFWIAISPMHLQALIYGNIEWMPLLGLLFPPPIALIFYVIKPQATFGLIILLLIREYRRASWKGLMLVLAPTLALFLIWFVLWGLPPVPGPNNPGQKSLFPFSLLLGLPALYYAIKKDDLRLASFVGPFVSPYVTFHGYLPALFPFKKYWMALVVLASFVLVVLGLAD